MDTRRTDQLGTYTGSLRQAGRAAASRMAAVLLAVLAMGAAIGDGDRRMSGWATVGHFAPVATDGERVYVVDWQSADETVAIVVRDADDLAVVDVLPTDTAGLPVRSQVGDGVLVVSYKRTVQEESTYTVAHGPGQGEG